MNNLIEKAKISPKDLDRLKRFRLMDDIFMMACFDGFIEGAELLLRIILGRDDLTVTRVTTQKRMKNLSGRDVVLDIDAEDDSGKVYDIEIQRSDEGADRKRARYHSSLIDAHLLKPGDEFNDLPDTFVIFITENDTIGGRQPLYRIERKIEETAESFNDGEHIVYVNGSDRNSETALGRLMHDFFCTAADDMYYKTLAGKVRHMKEDEKGVAGMSSVIDEIREEGEQIGKQIGEQIGKQIGEQIGKQIGEQEGTQKTNLNAIKNVMESFNVTVDIAMDSLKIPQNEKEIYAALLRNES